MKHQLNLSGIGLGIYIIGLGIGSILQQTFHFHMLGFWLQLYPILLIFLGLDFILANSNRTAPFFTKPGPLVIALLILFTVIGAIGNFCIRNLHFGITQFRDFDHFEHGFPNWEQEPRAHAREFTVNQNFRLSSAIHTVKILNQSGNIHIHNITGNTITAKAQIRSRFHHKPLLENQFKLIGDIQGDTFLIRLDFPRKFGGFIRRFNSDIILNIPEQLSVELENSTGDIEVAALANNLNIKTKYGDIRIKSIGRDLKLSTMFGDVTVESITGNAQISTKAGDIDIKKIKGNTNIESISGDVTIEECDGPTNIELKSGNLDIGLTKIDGKCDFDLKSGNVRLGLPATVRFTLDARSISGNIDSDFKMEVKKEFAGATASGNINGGGPVVKIRDISGNIKLKNLSKR